MRVEGQWNETVPVAHRTLDGGAASAATGTCQQVLGPYLTWKLMPFESSFACASWIPVMRVLYLDVHGPTQGLRIPRL